MGEVIEQSNKYRYLFLFSLSSFTVNLFSAQLSPMANQIMSMFKINEVQYTSLYMCNLIPTVVLGIPCAMIVRRFGLKRSQCFCIMIGLIGLILRLFGRNYNLFYIAWLLFGLTNVVVATMSAATFSLLFNKNDIGTAVGIMIASGAGGKGIAEVSTLYLPSFDFMLIFDVVIQCIVLILWLFSIKDIQYKKTDFTFMQSLNNIIHNKYIWISAIALMLVFGLYTGLSANLPMIIKTKGYSLQISGYITSYISIGYFLGAISIPKIISKLNQNRRIMILLAVTCSIATMASSVVTNEAMLIVCVMIIGVCVGGLLPMSIAIPSTLLGFGVQRSQVAGSLLTTFQLLGAVLIPTFIVVPLAADNIYDILVYSAWLMLVEGILFCFLPKKENKRIL